MEEEENNDEQVSTPFWVQNTANFPHRSRISSFFFSLSTVVLLLSIAAAAVILLLSYTNQKQNNVKKSWEDTLSIVLILVSALVGFLSRNRDGGDSYNNEFQASDGIQNSGPSTPNKMEMEMETSLLHQSAQWYPDYQDKFMDKSCVLRRNSISYPDMASNFDDEIDFRGRVFDNRPDMSHHLHRRHRSMDEVYYQMMDEPQNNFSTADTRPLNSSQLLPVVAEGEEDLKNVRGGRSAPRNLARNLENKTQNEKSRNERGRSSRKHGRHIENSYLVSTGKTIPSPPGQKIGKSDRKAGGETENAAKDIFDSLYYKKKRHRHKSADDLHSLFHEAQSFELPEGEGSAIRNPDSSTQRKHRRTISVPINPASAPRPPPPSPPRSGTRGMPSKSLESTAHTPQTSNFNSSGEFQLNRRIPPPLQPPSPSLLKTHVWKFVVKGDYVKINSDSDSASDSADSNGGQFQQTSPKSPDVNTKADNFITSFRAKLKLEKIDSMRKRDLGPSTLSPHSKPK